MTSKIQQGLSKVSASARGRLQGVKGRGYQAATVSADLSAAQSKSKLANSLGNFVDVATKASHYYIDKREEAAKKNVAQIMAEMPKEVIQAARADGTIRAHDDPYTVAALNRALGSMEADAADSQVMELARKGEFKSREEFSQALYEARKSKGSDLASAYGIDPSDPDWRAGFDSKAEEKNIMMFNQFDGMLDQQTKTLSQMTTNARAASIVRDPNMTSAERAEALRNLQAFSYDSGQLRNAESLGNFRQATISELAAAGDIETLMAYGETTQVIDGEEHKVRDLMGAAAFDNALATAEQNVFAKNLENREAFIKDRNDVLQNPNLDAAMNTWTSRYEELKKMQPSPIVSQAMDEWLQLRKSLDDRYTADAAAKRKGIEDQGMTRMRIDEIKNRIHRARNGEIVSTDPKDFEDHESWGKFTSNDFTTAYRELQEEVASNQSLSPEDQQRAIMQIAAVSPEDSMPRRMLAQKIGRAAQEFQASVIDETGQRPLNMESFKEFMGMYDANPDLVAQLFPDAAELATELRAVSTYGLSEETFRDYARMKNYEKKNPEMVKKATMDFQALFNNDKYKSLVGAPAHIQRAMKVAYDARRWASGGSPSEAAQGLMDYITQNTRSYSGDKEGRGMVAKSSLMVDGRPDSWQTSDALIQRTIDATIADLASKNMPINLKDVRVTTTDNGTIMVYDATARMKLRFTKDDFRKEYQTEVAKAAAVRKEAQEKKIQKMEKRVAESAKAKQLTGAYGDYLARGTTQPRLDSMFTLPPLPADPLNP